MMQNLMTLNNANTNNDYNYNGMNLPWYAAVGRNGIGIYNKASLLSDAAQRLLWIEIYQFPTIEWAKAWAYARYTFRYILRNGNDTSPVLPVNMAENTTFIDPRYAEREGNKKFPPLLM